MENLNDTRFFIDQKAFSVNKAFSVFNGFNDKIMFVDLPSFGLVKRLDFFRSEHKVYRRFYIKQDRILHMTSATYSLYVPKNNKDLLVAKFRAELGKNLLKRNIQIEDEDGKPICELCEQAGSGGFLGVLANAKFQFKKGEKILGSLDQVSSKRVELDLTNDPALLLDRRVAIGAAVVLLARLI